MSKKNIKDIKFDSLAADVTAKIEQQMRLLEADKDPAPSTSRQPDPIESLAASTATAIENQLQLLRDNSSNASIKYPTSRKKVEPKNVNTTADLKDTTALLKAELRNLQQQINEARGGQRDASGVNLPEDLSRNINQQVRMLEEGRGVRSDSRRSFLPRRVRDSRPQTVDFSRSRDRRNTSSRIPRPSRTNIRTVTPAAQARPRSQVVKKISTVTIQRPKDSRANSLRREHITTSRTAIEENQASRASIPRSTRASRDRISAGPAERPRESRAQQLRKQHIASQTSLGRTSTVSIERKTGTGTSVTKIKTVIGPPRESKAQRLRQQHIASSASRGSMGAASTGSVPRTRRSRPSVTKTNERPRESRAQQLRQQHIASSTSRASMEDAVVPRRRISRPATSGEQPRESRAQRLRQQHIASSASRGSMGRPSSGSMPGISNSSITKIKVITSGRPRESKSSRLRQQQISATISKTSMEEVPFARSRPSVTRASTPTNYPRESKAQRLRQQHIASAASRGSMGQPSGTSIQSRGSRPSSVSRVQQPPRESRASRLRHQHIKDAPQTGSSVTIVRKVSSGQKRHATGGRGLAPRVSNVSVRQVKVIKAPPKEKFAPFIGAVKNQTRQREFPPVQRLSEEKLKITLKKIPVGASGMSRPESRKDHQSRAATGQRKISKSRRKADFKYDNKLNKSITEEYNEDYIESRRILAQIERDRLNKDELPEEEQVRSKDNDLWYAIYQHEKDPEGAEEAANRLYAQAEQVQEQPGMWFTDEGRQDIVSHQQSHKSSSGHFDEIEAYQSPQRKPRRSYRMNVSSPMPTSGPFEVQVDVHGSPQLMRSPSENRRSPMLPSGHFDEIEAYQSPQRKPRRNYRMNVSSPMPASGPFEVQVDVHGSPQLTRSPSENRRSPMLPSGHFDEIEAYQSPQRKPRRNYRMDASSPIPASGQFEVEAMVHGSPGGRRSPGVSSRVISRTREHDWSHNVCVESNIEDITIVLNSSTEDLGQKKKFDSKTHNAKSSANVPINVDDIETEDIQPEVAAAIMHAEEHGINMEKGPENVFSFLFPQFVKESTSKISLTSQTQLDSNIDSINVKEDLYTDCYGPKETSTPTGSDTNVDSLEYPLQPEPPRYISRGQLRGSQYPPWFSGFFVALPDTNGIRIMSDPGSALNAAWQAVRPDQFNDEKLVVINS